MGKMGELCENGWWCGVKMCGCVVGRLVKFRDDQGSWQCCNCGDIDHNG